MMRPPSPPRSRPDPGTVRRRDVGERLALTLLLMIGVAATGLLGAAVYGAVRAAPLVVIATAALFAVCWLLATLLARLLDRLDLL